jgi:hypothetical protein
MLRLLTLPLLLFALTVAAGAQATRVDGIEIVDWGIFRNDRHAIVPDPDSAAGTRNIVGNIQLQQATTTVPALVGMKFGFHFRVVGSPPGGIVTLKFVTRFPRQGITNPNSAKTFPSTEFYSSAVVGATSYRGYALDYDWEVETGPWTLEIWHEGRKLAEKTFIVTRLVSSAE